MAIQSINNGMLNAYQKHSGNVTDQANPNNQGKRTHGQPELPEQAAQQAVNAHASIRQQHQASLVAHLFGDSSSATENALKITFQEAIDKLNEILSAELQQTEFQPISQETLKSQGGMEYWTPENTAQRIIDGSTAFLAGFQKNHPELEGEELINRFLDVIGGGITQGFSQAKDVLGNLKVLEGDIEETVDLTYQKVQEGLERFKSDFLGISSSPETETSNDSETGSTTESKTSDNASERESDNLTE